MTVEDLDLLEDGGGYLYCAPGAEIAEALRLLGQWFDDMMSRRGEPCA